MPLDLATALAASTQAVRPPVTHLLGWVTGFTSTTVTVLLADDDETQTTVAKVRSYTSPNVDDVVLLLNAHGTLYAVGALNAAPKPPPPPDEGDDPPPKPSVRTRTFRPNYSGSYFNGRWVGGNFSQGNLGNGMRNGAVFYGTGPGGLRGEPLSGKIRVKRVPEGRDGYSIRPTFRLVKQRNKPNGGPNYQWSLRGPSLRMGETATVNLPVSWVRQLMNGSCGGIGISVNNPTPHIALAGKGNWGPAMELTIKYRR